MRCNFAYVYGYFRWHCMSHCLDVNECMEKGLCPGHCENTIGSYTCMSKDRLKTVPYEDCPPGYQWESATGLCTGINIFDIKTAQFFRFFILYNCDFYCILSA